MIISNGSQAFARDHGDKGGIDGATNSGRGRKGRCGKVALWLEGVANFFLLGTSVSVIFEEIP